MNNHFDEREDHFFVGREEEAQRFADFLSSPGSTGKPIWNVYGTGGIGKSTLLDKFRRIAGRAGALFVMVDCSLLSRSSERLLYEIGEQLRQTAGFESEMDIDCTGKLNAAASKRKIALCLDNYEEIGSLELWLRDRFVKLLDERILVILSGRHPLRGAWLQSPVWREKIERIELHDLTAEQSKAYMEKLGYTNRTAQQLTWASSYGHPLTLSLACSVLPNNDSEAWQHSTDYIGELAILWLKETTDASLRSVTQAASMLGTFNQEALSYITERDVDVDEFQRLISLSFVRRTSNGWTFHKLIRSVITKQLKDSSPTLYEKWTYRSAKYYADAIVRRSDHYNTAWALEQFFYHAGNALHRTIAHNPDGSNCRWEIANESDLEDAENFIRRSLEQSREGYFEGMDPRAGEPYRIVISKEESLYSLKDLDIRRIHSIAANAIVLLRSHDGEILGLTAIIPINADTLPYLEQDPYSKPYIESLSSEERALFERTGDPSPYFFMRRLSLLDITGRVTFSECVDLMYSLMSEGLLYVCAPPPTPFFASVSAAFGFVEVSVHDPAAPPVYALDLRGGRLEAYVEGMMSSLQPMNPQKTQTPSYAEPAAAPAAAPESAAIKSLSAREQDVVKLVLEGYSNAQIAKTLFISEATVKKHLYTIYNKLEVKNRAQLVKLTMVQG